MHKRVPCIIFNLADLLVTITVNTKRKLDYNFHLFSSFCWNKVVLVTFGVFVHRTHVDYVFVGGVVRWGVVVVVVVIVSLIAILIHQWSVACVIIPTGIDLELEK